MSLILPMSMSHGRQLRGGQDANRGTGQDADRSADLFDHP